jgi:hypothetical protein
MKPPYPIVLLIPVLAMAGEVWRPFSEDSPWNQPITAGTPTDPASVALIDDLASRGVFFVNIRDWSIPVYFVDAEKTPRHDVGDLRPGIYGAGFEFPRQIPIPDDAVASPPVGDHSDNHLSVIDRERGQEWGMWATRRDATGRWMTGLGAVTDLRGTGVAPPWFDSPRELDSHRARAGGFPLIAGLIMLEEIEAGAIEHTLVFAYDHCRSGHFIPPASTAQVTQLEAIDSRGIPMGGRIQLDPTWDVESSGLSRAGKIIARALQKYGAFCGDYAGANVLYAENSPEAVEQWRGILDPRDLETVFTPEFIRAHFRVVDMGNLLPGQNLSVPPPYLIELEIEGQPAPVRIDQFNRTITLNGPANVARATWKTHPRDSKLVCAGRTLNGGEGTIDLSAIESITLVVPDGAQSAWRVVKSR